MLPILGYVGVCLAVAAILIQLRGTHQIRIAERNMVGLMQVELNRHKLEALRDELLALKKLAVKLGFSEMERFYDIEHKMNLLVVKLDQIERVLIDQGLQQPSEKGRLEYMLKLVNMSIAADY